MLKWFLRKNGDVVEKIPLADVFSGKVVLPFPMSYLKMAADDRPWEGKPHVTDLLNGPRMLYLKSTTDYGVDPADAAFRVLGVASHKKLEGLGDTSEIELEDDDVVGRSDVLDENPDGTYTITDYKVVGSFKITQALGLISVDEPVRDANGELTYFKSGDRKGQMKTHKVQHLVPEKADTKEWSRQLNIYRYLAEKQLGIQITKLQIFAIVRDGNTIAATSRGVVESTYLIPIKLFAKDVVEEFIKTRSEEIKQAFKTKTIPRVCDEDESWSGRRCRDYCPVAEACAAAGCKWLSTEAPAAPEAE